LRDEYVFPHLVCCPITFVSFERQARHSGWSDTGALAGAGRRAASSPVFTDPVEALRCAIEMQLQIHTLAPAGPDETPYDRREEAMVK
jgi:hypothetical protein